MKRSRGRGKPGTDHGVLANFKTTLKMIVKCKKCLPKEGIEVPDFAISEKNKLVELTGRSPIHAAKYIIDNFKLSHRDAKYIVTHISRIYGQCGGCKFDSLEGEYINCPECGALNLNWKMDYRTGIPCI